MKKFNIKRLTNEDTNAFNFIAKIHEEIPTAWLDDYHVSDDMIKSTEEKLVTNHKTQEIFCSIIECEDTIVSYIWAEVNKLNRKQIDIMSLWTDENYRGRGMAKNLKIALEKWSKDEMNAEKIHTTVSSKNENMIKLNAKLGYHTEYYRMIKKL